MPTSALVTVKAGARGVDFSFAKPPAARLVELGFEFVVGYISVPPATAAKNITKAQCEGYLAAGLKVLLVWEMSATSANQGATVGATHGRQAAVCAAACGYPTDVPILCADDTNTVPTNIDAHEAYVRAFAAACAPYPIGIYGDTDILTRCNGLWRIGWVPNAWSWSGSSRANAEAKARAIGAHVLQRTGFHLDGLWAVDPNEAIADFPAWGPAIIPDPPPTPPPPPDEEDDVKSVIYTVRSETDQSFVWMKVSDNDQVRQIVNGQEKTLLVAQGADERDPESTGHFRQMLQTLQPVGRLNATATAVLGGAAVGDWDARSYRNQPAGNVTVDFPPYVIQLTGSATPGE